MSKAAADKSGVEPMAEEADVHMGGGEQDGEQDGERGRKRALEPSNGASAEETRALQPAEWTVDESPPKRARESEAAEAGAEAEEEGGNGRDSLLTEQEAAVYDRQIRVWGVEAQRRLSKARVLMVGMSGVIAETCKNIVLAGIGSLTLLDDRPVSAEAASTNFLIFSEGADLGRRSLASASADALRDYNPMVTVGVENGNIVDKPGEFYDDFDAVVLDRASLNLKKHVNALCRSRPQKVAFYAVDCRYSCASLFVDLQTISYTSTSGGQTAESSKDYPSLKEALAVRLDTLPKKRTSSMLFASRIIDEFEAMEKRQPGQISAEDKPTLLKFAQKYLTSQGLSLAPAVEKLIVKIAEAGRSELPPISAIMGGILGQELIKGVSCKGEPLRNYFFFDTGDGKGIVEDIALNRRKAIEQVKERLQV